MTKKEALNHLQEREQFFINKQIYDRAKRMRKLYDIVNKANYFINLELIKTVGIHIEPNQITVETVYT